MSNMKVAVVGCGTMGLGIAQAAAAAGFDTTICKYTYPDDVDRVQASFEDKLAEGVKKGRIAPEMQSTILENLRWSKDVEYILSNNACNLVIESVKEELEVKQEVFRRMDRAAPTRYPTIFASNTSSLSIEKLSVVTRRPERVLGLHFFIPAHASKVVEVVQTPILSLDVAEAVQEFVHQLGKTPIVVANTPGFVVNRFMMNNVLYAIRCFEQGLNSIENLDKLATLALAHKMGPFELCDYIGLDVVLAIAKNLHKDLLDERFAPPQLLLRLVDMGMLGKKTKKGFYDYTTNPPGPNWGMRTCTVDGM